VKANVHFVTRRTGGDGAFREIIDFILQAQGKLEPILKQVKASAWEKGPKPPLEVITSQEGIA